MRHKYETRGMVLGRTPLGEASAFVNIITPELGLVRARAQSIRRSGAKLASALTTFAESSFVLVRGAENWRIAGAVLEKNWFMRIQTSGSRTRAARVCGLVLRLVAGETYDPKLFPIIVSYFEALTTLPKELQDAAEILAALRTLSVLGLDAGDIPESSPTFSPEILAMVTNDRARYIARINNGIAASGL